MFTERRKSKELNVRLGELSLLPCVGWEMSSSLGKGLVCLIWAVVCLLAANRGVHLYADAGNR